jgi:HEAT repeat protein
MPRRSAAVVVLGVVSLLVPGCRSVEPPQKSLDERVHDFVIPTYAEGVPYEKARALGPQAEPILLNLLDRQDLTASRSNIVVTLGILGSPAAVQRIITVLETGVGALAPDEVQTRMDAVVALGYAANVATDATALNYLLSGADVAYWGPPRIKWMLPDGGSAASRLRTRAISALGLSGKSAALQMLQKLQTTGGGRGGQTASEQALIAESIETNQYIAKNGLSQYYQTRRF